MADAISTHEPAPAGHVHAQAHGVLLTPLVTQTDGFYIFLARRG
jgi:hypothetical protein